MERVRKGACRILPHVCCVCGEVIKAEKVGRKWQPIQVNIRDAKPGEKIFKEYHVKCYK